MFGQQSSTPFGSPPANNPTGFGTQTNTTPAFGGGSAFGSSTATPSTGGFGGFGTPSPAPTGFGGFGGQAPAPGGFGSAPGSFGSPPAAAPTGGFGSSTAPTPFGAPAPTGGLFGGGAPAPAAGGGLFGGGSTTTTSAFGSTPAPATGGFGGFGNTANTSSGFGAPSTGTFGSPAPAPGGLFGSTAPAPSAFGSTPTTTSAFGTPAPSGGGLFGGGAPAPSGLFGAQPGTSPAGGGSKASPYQVTNRVDGASSMSLQAITAMSVYENKSFEEIRFEDYGMGNKGDGAGGTSGGFGGFGSTAPTPAPGAFGAPAPAPGGLFGNAPTPAPGAFGSTGAFGAPAPAPVAFGAPAPGAFGSTAAPAPSAFGGFGSSTNAPAPGAFGGFGSTAAKAPAPLFGGAPAPAPGGLFGNAPAAPAPATGGLFGSTTAPAPGGLFGSTPAPATSLFGAPAPAPTGLFGSTPAPGAFGAATSPGAAPSTGLFGATSPAPAFGAPAPAAAGGLFGAPAPAAGGLFGTANPPGTGLFGAPAPSTGAFASPAQAPGATGLFGSTPAVSAAPFAISTGAVPVGAISMPASDEVLATQLAAIKSQTEQLEKREVWQSLSSKKPTVVAHSLPENVARLSSYSAASPGLRSYQPAPKSNARIRPRGFGPTKSTSPTLALGHIGNGGSPIMNPNAHIGSAVKRLVIKPDALTKKPAGRILLAEHPVGVTNGFDRQPVASPLDDRGVASPNVPTGGEQTPRSTLPFSSQERVAEAQNGDTPEQRTPGVPDGSSPALAKKSSTPTNGRSYDFYKQVVSPNSVRIPVEARDTETTQSQNVVPKLTKAGYTMTPSEEELAVMSEAELATVSGFAVTREGYGSVSWEGAVDVRGVDLDAIVAIERRDVSVYNDEEASGTKPPVGSKLNRPAVITMCEVFPKEGQHAEAAVKQKYERKLTKQTSKMGAKHVSYNAENGVWKFRVSHFSRYALTDDSDDDSDEEQDVDQEVILDEPKEAHFESGERGGRSPEAMDVGREDLPEVVTEEQAVDAIVVSDAESPDTSVLQAAEKAYAMFTQMEVSDAADDSDVRQLRSGSMEDADTEDFPDEGWYESDDGDARGPIPLGELPFTRSKSGIVAKLIKKSGLKSETASSTDYGIRMGRSFRVGWGPDGSFLQLRPMSSDDTPVGTLVVRRPRFANKETGGDIGASNLETHLHHSSKDTTSIEGCPFFSLPRVDGTPSSHTSWCSAVSGYAQSSGFTTATAFDFEQSQIVARAFSLLMALFGVEKDGVAGVLGENDASSLSNRRVQAFSNWLKVACAKDAQRDIRTSIQKNDIHSAILAALTGGDILRASQIATENGYIHLSAIMSSGVSGRDDVREQVKRWHESGAASHIDASLLRIYKLLGGDLELEEKLHTSGGRSISALSLDWRRRLAMIVFYGCSENTERDPIANFVRKYDDGVVSGVAPNPFPRYVTNGSRVANGDEDCLLYRILQLYSDRYGRTDDRSPRRIADIVFPLGYTISRHNISHAFHLAVVISALGRCGPLSPMEKANLIHTYAAQLVDAGMWEWASYVNLCLMDDASSEELQWRRQRAKSIVLQFFRRDDPLSSSRRSFLETAVGVPSAWFEEAVAQRCAYVGDVHGYVTRLSYFSPERARMAFEELMLPNLLFVRTGEESMKLLELFGTEDGTLAAAAFDLYRLSAEVLRLARNEPKESKEGATRLLEHAAQVHATLQAYTSDKRVDSRARSVRMHPGYRVLPLSSFLSEAMSALSFVTLQLKALKAGVSIVDDRHQYEKSSVVQMKVASQLSFLSASEPLVVGSGSSSEDVLMGSI